MEKTHAESTTKTTTPRPFRTPGAEAVRYLVNEAGERESVVPPVTLFERLIEELEELEDIRDAEVALKEDEWDSLDDVKARLGL